MTKQKREGRTPKVIHADTPIGGSREAMLGAGGLRIVKAVAQVPARPPRRSAPARTAFTDPRGGRGMSPNASREAGLGGTAPRVRPAGGLATDDDSDATPASQDDPYPAGDEPAEPE